jgi:hypothetical protein
MLGAEQVDRASRRGVRRDELGRQHLDPAVDCVGDGDREARGGARRERQAERLGRVVDPVDVLAVDRARNRARALFLPALDQDEGALIPEGQVGEDGADGPAGVERAGQLAVAQAVDEGAQAPALVVVLGDVRRGHAHLPTPSQRV